MVNAIFCAHGKLACAMLESVQMVYGNANVEAVEFVPGENAGDIVAKQTCVVWKQLATAEEDF
ncbi:hypothetical protein R4I74_003875 [Escherichia coli]|nr:hypothetical protein [Escherichia coli]